MTEGINFNDAPPADTRDYFKITAFQKKAEAIDSNPAHAWGLVTTPFIAENENGSFIMGTYVDETDSRRLLLANRTADGVCSSVDLQNLTAPQIGEVTDTFDTILPNLPDSLRHSFITAIIEHLSEVKPGDLLSERMVNYALDLLPATDSSGMTAEEVNNSPLMKSLPAEKQKTFAEFLLKVSQKMPATVFTEKLAEFTESLPFRSNPFSEQSYPFLFTEITRWVLDSRPDTKRDFSLLQQPAPAKYFVGDMVQHPITTKEDLVFSLNSLPVESMPDISGRKIGAQHAEMVDLGLLVGGATISSWSVSTSAGRGVDRIFELAQDFQTNERDVVGDNDPISAYKIDGKYYINTDGRHRSAALKALGVKSIPMLVSEVD